MFETKASQWMQVQKQLVKQIRQQSGDRGTLHLTVHYPMEIDGGDNRAVRHWINEMLRRRGTDPSTFITGRSTLITDPSTLISDLSTINHRSERINQQS
jgi:hypothetical protein